MIIKRLAASFRSESILLAIVILAAAGMILTNYFTIKILSAARAYSSGESSYSKGQKDAARNLVMFVSTGDTQYWNSYLNELSIPIGDSIARVGLINDEDDAIIRRGFLAGKNHPEDIDDLIWMFRNFNKISFMKNAIQVWREADDLVGQELKFAQQLKARSDKGQISETDRAAIILEINEMTTRLTLKERAFADILGEASRNIRSSLFLANVVMTLVIIGGTFLYARLMFKKLREKNLALESINEELDKFVYSASHDLRAPITSVRGLIDLARIEKDPTQLMLYLELMEQSLMKQDLFISDIIDFARNKQTTITLQEIDLGRLVDDAVAQHRFMDIAKGIEIFKDVRARKLKADELRVKIILNNLLSNAIKYSDPGKEVRMITIRTRQNKGSVLLQVQDNGLGISKDDLGKIFEMFFVTRKSAKSSGLGLYITHETVQKMNGTISVDSLPGMGTTFSVLLPDQVIGM